MATLAERQAADEKERGKVRRIQRAETLELIGRQRMERVRSILAITDEEWKRAEGEDVPGAA